MLEAARALFLESGLRGATMESIARRARVARPTLYAYFPDKEAMFRAVVADVVLRMKAAFEAALAGPGPAGPRVARAMADKYAAADALLAGSPHASELSSDRMLREGRDFREFQAWMTARIAETLRADGRPDAEALARMLIACCDGLAATSPDMRALGPQVAFVAERLLAEPERRPA